MKRFLLLFAVAFVVTIGYAQNINYTIESTFQPLSMEEMMMAARANAYRQELMKQRFEEYQDKAYNCYNKGDFNGLSFTQTMPSTLVGTTVSYTMTEVLHMKCFMSIARLKRSTNEL